MEIATRPEIVVSCKILCSHNCQQCIEGLRGLGAFRKLPQLYQGTYSHLQRFLTTKYICRYGTKLYVRYGMIQEFFFNNF